MKRIIIKFLIWCITASMIVFITVDVVDKMYTVGQEQEKEMARVVEEMQEIGKEFKTGNILIDNEVQDYIREYLGGNELKAIRQKYNMYKKIQRLENDAKEKAAMLTKNKVYLSEEGIEKYELDEVVEKTEYLYTRIEKAEVNANRQSDKDMLIITLYGTLVNSILLTAGYMLSSCIKKKPKKEEEEQEVELTV